MGKTKSQEHTTPLLKNNGSGKSAARKGRSQTFHVDTLVVGAFVVLARTLLLKQAGICGRRDSSQQNAEWQKDAQEVEACKFVVKVWAGRVVEGARRSGGKPDLSDPDDQTKPSQYGTFAGESKQADQRMAPFY